MVSNTDTSNPFAAVINESDTYLIAKYKEWCMSNPDKVCYEDSKIGTSREDFVRNFFETKAESGLADLFEKERNSTLKSDDRAKQYREAGNELYKAKKNLEALQEYTNALLLCESEGSEAMAMAFANRSAVLMAIGSSEALLAAIRDSHRAIKGGYPTNSQYKLYDRIGRCYYKLKRMDQASAAFKAAIGAVESSNLAEDAKTKLKKDIEKVMRPLAAKVDSSSTKLEDVKVDGEPIACPKISCPSKQFPNFSVSLAVVYNAQVGRHVVAKRKIKAGETLCVEAPLASFLDLAERGKSTCSHCFNQVWDPLPSPISTQDVFCCKPCIKEAVDSYHMAETKVFEYLRGCNLDKQDWFLGLRAVSQRPLDFFLANKEMLSNHDPTYGTKLAPEEVYQPYKGLYNLVDNDEHLPSAKKQFRAFVAYFICCCLEKGGYFKTSKDLEEDKMFIANLLDHFMGAASMNCHEVGRYTVPTGATLMEGVVRSMGTSLEPCMDLMNHSCDPAILRFSVGNCLVAVAIRDIEEGQEVTDCYYKAYHDGARQERRDYLTKYCFNCACEACDQCWPTAAESPRALVDIPDSQLRFDPESNPQAMKQAFDRINRIGTKIAMEQKQANVDLVLPLCLEFQEALKAAIKPPHNFYVMAFRSYFKSNWIVKGSVEIIQP